jgi:hypothetical protein
MWIQSLEFIELAQRCGYVNRVPPQDKEEKCSFATPVYMGSSLTATTGYAYTRAAGAEFRRAPAGAIRFIRH